MLIKNEREKARKIQQIKEAQLLIIQNRELLHRVGLTDDQIEQHVAPTKAILEQLQKEVDEYEKLRMGNLPDEEPIQRIGEFLVKLRISQGLTQKALADKIDVDETQVSRDERNLYKGVSLERLLRVIEALGVKVDVKVNEETNDLVEAQ